MTGERASVGQVQHALLDLIDAASTLTMSEGKTRAYDAASQIEDLELLQRVAAGLAMVVAFELVSNPRPGAGTIAMYRARLGPWVERQRLEATWAVDQ